MDKQSKTVKQLSIKLVAIAIWFGSCGTVYNHVNYIDIDKGAVQVDVSVKINNGTIKVVKSKKKGEDLKGKFLMPALLDMHVHWPDTLNLEHANAWAQAGVSNIRIMNSDAATAHQRKLSSLENIETSIGFPFRKQHNVLNAAQLMDSIKGAGFNFVKFFSVQSQQSFIDLAKAAQEAKLPICGHALTNVQIDTAFYYGYKSVEHVGYLENLTGSTLDSALQKFKQYDVAICPTIDWTLVAYGYLTKDSIINRSTYLKNGANLAAYWNQTYTTPNERFGDKAPQYANAAKSILAKRQAILLKAHNMGISIIAGSDAEEAFQVPGFSLVAELKHIASAGISNADVLKMATSNAAKYWKQTNNKAPKAAYILLDKNPLLDLSNLYQSNIKFVK